MSGLTYVENTHLADVIRSDAITGTAILDVRDADEVAEGHIKGAINVPASELNIEAKLDELIDTQLAGKETVVVHCKLSQQRGPRSAELLTKRLQERGLLQPSVQVLSGGYQAFSRAHAGDAGLLEVPTPE